MKRFPPTATPPRPAPPLSLLGTIASITCYSPRTISYFFVLATLDPHPPQYREGPPYVLVPYPLQFLFFIWYGAFLRCFTHLRPHNMTLLCTPDVGVPLPPEDISYPELRERAAAACKTLEHLAVNGLPPEAFDPTPTDADTVANLIDSFAEDEVKTNKSLDTQKFSAISPAAVFQVNELLTEFGLAVVKNAVQVRHLVTNKLILETENPDARVRIRALELLGKMSDVGLFTERSEVVVTHRSTDDLKLSLREKLQKLRSKVAKEEASDAIIDMEAHAPLQDIDVDAELGL